MFPETVRTGAEVSAQYSVSLIKKLYRYISKINRKTKTTQTAEFDENVNVFQFLPHGPLGGHYLLHDLGAASCVWDRTATAGAAAATAAETGGCAWATKSRDGPPTWKNRHDRQTCDTFVPLSNLWQILLGPNTGMSGGMQGMMPPAPGKMWPRSSLNSRAAASNAKLQVTRRDRETTETSRGLASEWKIDVHGDIGLAPHIGSFNGSKGGEWCASC